MSTLSIGSITGPIKYSLMALLLLAIMQGLILGMLWDVSSAVMDVILVAVMGPVDLP